MTIQDAIYSYLSSYTALTTYCSNRIYPESLPQAPKQPTVTYNLISEEEVDTFEQPESTMIGPTFQFDCFATSAATANAMGWQVRKAFKNYSGLMGGSAGVTISGIEKINSLNSTYTDPDGRIIASVNSTDYQIWYQE